VKHKARAKTNQRPAGGTQQKLENVGECLYRSASSRVYYGLTYVGKRQIKKSLRTDDHQLAKARLAEFRAKVGNLKPNAMAKMSFLLLGNCWLADHQHNLKPSTILRKRGSIEKLNEMFGRKPIRNIGPGDVSRWKEVVGSKAAGRSFNWELDVMRGVFQYAIKRGLVLGDPTADTERMKTRYRPVVIPTKDEFKALATQLHKTHKDAQAGDFVEFLAYSGTRKNEAAQVTWGDVKFDMHGGKGALFIAVNAPALAGPVGDDKIKTESSRRVIPMNPKLREFLLNLQAKRRKPKPTDRLFTIDSARKGLETACEKLWGKEKKKRFTHHDFRHLFATTCIESGVDIPTVSKWLGHKDGGALAMKTYGHLREQHSAQEAAKVKFD
jgi:integrase